MLLRRSGLLVVVLGIMVAAAAVAGGPPAGWFQSGTDQVGYEVGTDADGGVDGGPAAFIEGTDPVKGKFGTLTQVFLADDYRGQRVRLRVQVKSRKVADWAGMWLRVDRGEKVVAFDNMQRRPIKGTTDWHEVAIVLDVPRDATQILMGLLMQGHGKVWMDKLVFETVGQDVPVTDQYAPPATRKPKNLNFGE